LTGGPALLLWTATPRERGDFCQEVRAMHVVIRRYSGAAQLMGEMERRKDYAVRSGADVLVTITVCDDRAGTDESNRLAREWVQQNVPGVSMGPPEVIDGQAFIEFWR
jgi:hypothetical protein